MIELKNTSKSFKSISGNQTLFTQLDATILQGQFIALTGASGEGKSTLLSIIGLLEKIDSGDILYHGQSVKKMSFNDKALIRNQQIGFVFQGFQLLDHLSVIENIMLPTHLQKNADKPVYLKKRAKALIEQLGLEKHIHKKSIQLSGGQQQRVAIARAMINQPKIILADEPTGNLDSKNSDNVMKLFHQLNKQGQTILLVTHDEKIAQSCPIQWHLSKSKLSIK